MAEKKKPAKAPKKTKAAKAKTKNDGPMPHLHKGTGYIRKPE